MLHRASRTLVLVAGLAALLVHAAEGRELGLVQKQVFTLPSYTTVNGQVIRDVRLGYETYGQLNAAGDNAVFVAHFYSGTSHAAGRYRADDPAPGYWDAIIGPGKAIDTDRYFVVSADTFANLNARDPNVTTTGPASLDPATGRPYGLRFPVVALSDSVRVHKALVDSLGVTKLVAAIGASGGSIQAMEWAALYPDFVERVVHVIGPGFEVHPYVIALVDVWNTPIRMDPRWNGGDYYGGEEPVDGVAQSLKIITLTARHWGWAENAYGYLPAEEGKDPGAAIGNEFGIVGALNAAGAARGHLIDANSVLYMSRAASLYRLTDEEVAGIRAKILFVPAASDVIFPPELSASAMVRFRALGGRAELVTLQGVGGHLDGVFEITQAADAIRRFLASE